MKNNDILKVLVIVILLVGVALVYFWTGITGAVVFDNTTYYTKAICDDENFCQDYEIYCEGDVFVEMIPIDGAVVQHDWDWIDPRGEEMKLELC